MKSKRVFDLVFSFLGIILLLPLLVAIGIWVRIDSDGPVLFRQVRVGRFGKNFQILKFRTMVCRAEQLGRQITVGADPRITRSGAFLRKCKLDELPQLINVLKGEMSFVGARPEVPHYVLLYTPEQTKVLDLPPGITDVASIYFRNESELLAQADDPEKFYIQKVMPYKLQLNAEYRSKVGILKDVEIILLTLKSILWDNDPIHQEFSMFALDMSGEEENSPDRIIIS
jgi:lipopolysaccharide/colanic/teichoic acid biosynthesis glycosyltransferase